MTFRSGSIYRHHPAEQLGESAIVQLIALKLPRLGFDKIMASDWLETASITVDLTNTGKTSLSADTCRNFDSSVQRLLGYLNNGDCAYRGLASRVGHHWQNVSARSASINIKRCTAGCESRPDTVVYIGAENWLLEPQGVSSGKAGHEGTETQGELRMELGEGSYGRNSGVRMSRNFDGFTLCLCASVALLLKEHRPKTRKDWPAGLGSPIEIHLQNK